MTINRASLLKSRHRAAVIAAGKARRRKMHSLYQVCFSKVTAVTVQLAALTLTLSVLIASIMVLPRFATKYGARLGGTTTQRKRKSYVELLAEFVVGKFRRMYRMHEHSFLALYHQVEPYLKNSTVRKRGATPNGVITNEARLLMALRFFAGGCKHDIGTVHGVHENEVYRSVWRVVDAIHLTRSLDIKFPRTHHEQAAIAAGFREKSDASFSNCVGCIDGMLVWTSKPVETTKELGVGPSKFFSGRKGKFGQQIQAICGPDRKFLDVYCDHPGSASDYTMWIDSKIRQDVEKVGFLYPGLVLFGDNAYVNTPYMVAPFKAVSSGPKDDFNFFHSQVRINIECSFGMLVHRWGCLRKPMPVNVRVGKINSLFLALCKLHNFCIGEKHNDVEILAHDCEVARNIEDNEGLPLPTLALEATRDEYDASIGRLNGLLESNSSRLEYDPAIVDVNSLPIYTMLSHIENNGYRRPGLMGSTTTNNSRRS